MNTCSVLVTVTDRPGMLLALATVFAANRANITYVDLHATGDIPMSTSSSRQVTTCQAGSSTSYARYPASLISQRRHRWPGSMENASWSWAVVRRSDRWRSARPRPIDTISEENESRSIRSRSWVRRSWRRQFERSSGYRGFVLVLAGSLMGGEITKAVEEVRRNGLYVISLNMAGSVPDAADLVVSDPVQAGVMAVMAVAETAKFDLVRQRNRRY